MARTGKKSVRSKPSLLKSQVLQSRIAKKKSVSNNAKDRQLKEALDKELTSQDIVVKKLVEPGQTRKKKETVEEDNMLVSFAQLRGM